MTNGVEVNINGRLETIYVGFRDASQGWYAETATEVLVEGAPNGPKAMWLAMDLLKARGVGVRATLFKSSIEGQP